MKKTDAWMPLYIADYLADTQHLTAEQHGAYLLLLMQQWRSGVLPLDMDELAMMARVDITSFRKRVWPKLLKFFDETPDGYSQKRLAAERKHADDVSAKRSKSGRAGAENRWQDEVKKTDENGGGGQQDDGKTSGEAHGEPMANAMAKTTQNDGQRARTQPSPSQQQKEPPSPSGDAPPAKPDRLGSRLPENWRPSEPDCNFAACHFLNIEAVAANFRDYWIAQPGAKGRKTDWSATWRNWCRREAERRKPQPQRGKLDWMHDELQAERHGKTIDGSLIQ